MPPGVILVAFTLFLSWDRWSRLQRFRVLPFARRRRRFWAAFEGLQFSRSLGARDSSTFANAFAVGDNLLTEHVSDQPSFRKESTREIAAT